ncbi:hypothetical protein [Streptomyces sp. NRRL B-24484]|uniref:hypothetical protein n=1 Tax=Streptomyces sp. NRRL B-24484 TaxID=1463833 RepID=UPI0007C43C4E|nr:hypothetical protein [Streptomyces sp. NRRL B-24484]
MSTEPMTPERFAEIQAREEAATPGPWRWRGDTAARHLRLQTPHRGGLTIMDFIRWGMNGARPRFARGGLMYPADEMATYDYRKNVVGIDNPDAAFIAHARQDVADLIAEVGWLAAELADRIAELTTSARVAEQAWERNAAMAQEITELREQLATPVWKAYYDTITVGLFRTEAAARAACEDLIRCEDAAGAESATFDWIGDEDDPEEPRELCVAFPGLDEAPTGYCVVGAQVADTYDPDAES